MHFPVWVMQVKFIGSLGLTMFMSYDAASIVAFCVVVRARVCVCVCLFCCVLVVLRASGLVLCGGLGSGMCLMCLLRLSLCYFC